MMTAIVLAPRRAGSILLPLGVLSCYKSAQNLLRKTRRFVLMDESYVWREMCFCLLSPVSRFEAVRHCMEQLEMHGIINQLAQHPSRVRASDVSRLLIASIPSVRFPSQKASRLGGAATFFYADRSAEGILGFLGRFDSPRAARDGLTKNVPGLGLKEASHFLRNVGRGEDLAVLDTHVRRFLVEMRLVDESVADESSRKSYLDLERVLTGIAYQTGLDPGVLDLAVWQYMRGR